MKAVINKFCLFLLIPILFSCESVQPPKPYGVIPSRPQIDWQQMEYYMFVHFGPNTFTDVEWGDGKEDPKVFNPTNVDCRQWAATAKQAGMTGIIITAKHHDGFCLWPSKFSTHTVRESPWKDGKGDLLKELSEACKEYGLKFGVYLSPWDQNHPAYGTPEYNQTFANTLNEVLSGYGDVFEQWFDGANGEGHGGKKQVYDWPLFHSVVYKNQPNAVIFSDVGPGCRWMGNERGVAGKTNWSTLNITGFGPGHDAPPTEVLNMGNEGGEAWVPAETDVSIRPGWFYSPSTDEKVKTLEQLIDIYYTSVGRNSNLLLNVPPDRSGRIHYNDSVRLTDFHKAINDIFADNLIAGAEIKASNERGNQYRASNMLDENYETYWATQDNDLTPSVEINLSSNKIFNRLMLQEYIPLGQRISSFKVSYWNNKNSSWSDLLDGTTIGYKRILRFPTVETSKLKIEFKGLACPVISKIGLYLDKVLLSSPVIKRDKSGMVTINTDDPQVDMYYTTNGDVPSEESMKFEEDFSMPKKGIVKAIAISNGRKSGVSTKEYDVSPILWTVTSSGKDASSCIDGSEHTFAEMDKNEPLVIDLGEILLLKGFYYIPVNNVEAANIVKYNFYTSLDSKNWTKVKDGADFKNIKNNPIVQMTLFNDVTKCRYLKMQPLELTKEVDKYIVAELGVITK